MSGAKDRKAEISASSGYKGKKNMQPIPEPKEEDDESINSRIDGDSDMEGSYTNDFASASIQSEKPFAQSSKLLQGKAADIEESGYTDVYDDISVSQSHTAKKHMKSDKDGAPIEPVDEVEDSSSKE
jgi:hypothetical protein